MRGLLAVVLAMAASRTIAAQDTLVATPLLVWPARPAMELFLVTPAQPVPLRRTSWIHATIFDSVSHQFRRPIKWTSSDRRILSVEASGDTAARIIGHRIGRAIVTASSGSVIASRIFYVGVLPAPARMDLKPAHVKLRVGEYIRVFAEARDSLGRRLPSTFLHWQWTDSSVVQLVGMPNETEVIVHAVAPGVTTVVATLNGAAARSILHVVP